MHPHLHQRRPIKSWGTAPLFSRQDIRNVSGLNGIDDREAILVHLDYAKNDLVSR
jgi:hypothetical protein